MSDLQASHDPIHGRIAALGGTVPPDLAERAFVASVALLRSDFTAAIPFPTHETIPSSHPDAFAHALQGREERRTRSRWTNGWSSLAMAASIGMALVVAAPMATSLLQQPGVTSSSGAGLLPTSRAEPVLAALLQESDDASRGGDAWLVSELMLSERNVDVDSALVLEARNISFSDLADEMARMRNAAAASHP